MDRLPIRFAKIMTKIFKKSTAADWATRLRIVAGILGVIAFGSGAGAEEVSSKDDAEPAMTVEFKDAGVTRTVTGRKMLEAADGGVLLMGDAGRVWTIQPENIVRRDDSVGAYRPINSSDAADRVRDELGGRFNVFQTLHYVIVYNGDERHAKAVGELLEQVHRGFYAFWRNKGFEIHDTTLPLVALVFRDVSSYLEYADSEVGESAKNMYGYYHRETNHMITYNVPHWERNVSTVIHEATHQLAFNTGLQTRFADNPKWVSEGMAMFFESPDRRNPKRWRGVGNVNELNLRRWWKYFPRRPAESLVTLISSDDRLSFPQTAEAAYGESWALTYFLIRTRDKQYFEYLRKLADGPLMVELSKRDRIDMFEEAFDTTVADLDRDFVNYMRKVRIR